MADSHKREITCPQCGAKWEFDFARWARPDTVVYRGKENTRVEVFSVSCPKCGHRLAVEVTLRENDDA
jgi:DNA-directed RNA polymerase subunit RPC12/RpoP